jgi:putative transposase
MRAIASALKVARSNLQERKAMSSHYQIKSYYKADDAVLIPFIREIVDVRSTYGYRRVTVLLNKKLVEMKLAPVNHKRIYRIMQRENLLLKRHSGRPNQTHIGKIITLRPNTRWCSDTFVIQCWNGDRVHVAFSLDTCDREAMRYIASTIGVDGLAIRDLMLETVEYRFGKGYKVPYPIQWLSDNGSCYTARETVAFGRNLGFNICTTPAYSPESNGMAEAFVKTFKRDYVWSGNLQDAQTVMAQLPHWFEDYNERAPHKGLEMRSPREFLRLYNQG